MTRGRRRRYKAPSPVESETVAGLLKLGVRWDYVVQFKCGGPCGVVLSYIVKAVGFPPVRASLGRCEHFPNYQEPEDGPEIAAAIRRARAKPRNRDVQFDGRTDYVRIPPTTV